MLFLVSVALESNSLIYKILLTERLAKGFVYASHIVSGFGIGVNNGHNSQDASKKLSTKQISIRFKNIKSQMETL